MAESKQGLRNLKVTRVFDAPRERVWRAWTDPELFQRWWGPKDFTSAGNTMDLRVGGRYHWCMRAPDGQEFWTAGVYREIVPLKRLVYTDSFADEKGNVVQAAHYGFPADFPLEQLVTVTLEDVDGKTRMTLVHEDLPAGEHADLAEIGWTQTLDKLAAVVERSHATA
jgi:uncharacterized protein YndB with AHSA1/START domain